MAVLSLRRRLSLAFAAVLALLLALDIALTLLGAGRRIDPEVSNATALTSGALREATRGLKAGPELDRRLADLARSFDQLRHVRVTYRSEGGAVVQFAPTRPEPPGWFVAVVRPRAIAQTIAATVEGQRVGEFIVQGDPDDEIGELWESLVTLSIDGLVSAILGFVAIDLVARFALAPLERLNAGLAALSRRDYGARLPERAAPEFAPLLARFNALGQSLQAAERDNRDLRARLVSIQEEERKEIGRELHDEIGPYLFAARAQAGAARSAATAPVIDALIETIDALQATNRRILDRLRPVALEELGLGPALDALGRFFERSRADMNVRVDCAAPPLDKDLEVALYRIAQEALTNAARHSGADRLQVTLGVEGGALTLSVSDNGRGLDPARAAGRGLIGMRERVAAHDGALTLTPALPHGLVVRAAFPPPQ